MVKVIRKHIKNIDGANIYYKSSITDNTKPCLIFIHGLGGALNVWDKEAKFFKDEGVQSISVDLRGHGKSERSDTSDFYKFGNFVDDIIQIIKKEGLQSYTLVGHCLGGMISLAIGAKKTSGLKNLVLIDSIYKTPTPIEGFEKSTLAKLFLKFFVNHASNIPVQGQVDYQSFKGTGNFSIKRGISDILHVSLKSYLLICESLLGLNLVDLLDKISVPTLIVQGDKDLIVPTEVALTLKNRIKKSELDMIEGANHFLIINNPLDVSREIERFLIKRKFM